MVEPRPKPDDPLRANPGQPQAHSQHDYLLEALQPSRLSKKFAPEQIGAGPKRQPGMTYDCIDRESHVANRTVRDRPRPWDAIPDWIGDGHHCNQEQDDI